ncbi:hypothetical protein EG68_02138 [Paragonimus skrjabini miyazakii]|uniref:Uncharacterized protein n=1 Tax=Paragonimus skrjabini miyazakii TaxID=59628 RepID=A0A8S9ZAP9_9TREM|nr:hypothetical protein EG68_02138 [Paragonimus skrjabini miyazakii]
MHFSLWFHFLVQQSSSVYSHIGSQSTLNELPPKLYEKFSSATTPTFPFGEFPTSNNHVSQVMRPIPMYLLPTQIQPISKQYPVTAQPFLTPLPNQRSRILYNDQTVPVLNNQLNQGYPIGNGCALNMDLNLTTLLSQNSYPSGFFYRTLPNKNQCGSVKLSTEQRRLLLSGLTNTVIPNRDQTNFPQWTTVYPEGSEQGGMPTDGNPLKKRGLCPSQSLSDMSECLSHIQKSIDKQSIKEFVYHQSTNLGANSDYKNDTEAAVNNFVKSPEIQVSEEYKLNSDYYRHSSVVGELQQATSLDRRSQNLGSSFADSGVDMQGPINVELLDMCVPYDRKEIRKPYQPEVDEVKCSAVPSTTDYLNDKRRHTNYKSQKQTKLHQRETVLREKSNENVSKQNVRTTTKVDSGALTKTGLLHSDQKGNVNFSQKMLNHTRKVPPKSGVIRANETSFVTEDYPEGVNTKLLDGTVITTD